MATKYFCDYCGQEMQDPGTTVVIKMVLPRNNIDPSVARAYHDVCQGCVGHFTEQFDRFLDELGTTLGY